MRRLREMTAVETARLRRLPGTGLRDKAMRDLWGAERDLMRVRWGFSQSRQHELGKVGLQLTEDRADLHTDVGGRAGNTNKDGRHVPAGPG